MPKSTTAELSALREEVFTRDGGCVWLGCDTGARLELAHVKHRGMGGSREANRPENCVTLCKIHHDVFDGRTSLGTGRWELGRLLIELSQRRANL